MFGHHRKREVFSSVELLDPFRWGAAITEAVFLTAGSWRNLSIVVPVVVLATASGWVATVAAGDPVACWPQFHGPQRNNVSTETGLLKKWPDDGPELLWTARGLGFGYSSVAIADGKIYTAGNVDGRTMVFALHSDGQRLWQADAGRAWEKSYPGTRGTPTIDGERVYYETPLGDVVCLSAETGKILWQRNVLDEFHSPNIRWALAESLLVDGERVICCPGGPEVSVVALDKNTGGTVWKAESTGDLAGYASPILIDQDGLRIIVTLNSKAIIGVNADTGGLLWRTRHFTLFDENILQPLYHDGFVFASGLAAGTVKWKLVVQDDTASLKEIWRSRELDNHHGGVLLVDGYLYGSSTFFNREKWTCLDQESGARQYAERGIGKGSLTCAGGMLYILSERNVMGLAPATPKALEIVSQFPIPPGGEGPSWAHPVVCGGRLYVRHGEFLYVYKVADP